MKRQRCECGSELISRKENYRYAEKSLDNVTLEGVLVSRCEVCGASGVEIPRMGPLHETIARAFAEKKERLSPKEIRFLRKHLELGSAECADQLGVDPSTMSRYENAESPLAMSRQTERLFRVMVLLALDVRRDQVHLERFAIEEPTRARLVLRPHRQGWEWRWEASEKAAA